MLQDLPSLNAIVLIRADGDASAVLAEARRRFREIDKNLFVDIVSMDRQIEDNVFFQRLLATLAGVFGLLALLLASIGLYGMMAYSVARRSNEVGIRMALGADRRRIVGAVVRETMTLVGAGVVVVLVAVVSTRGGPASLCGRGSGLPGGESGFDPEVPFRFERLRSWASQLSITARWRALLASALLSMLACSS